jgi:serine/threonine-protein kinase TTK/MPS1
MACSQVGRPSDVWSLGCILYQMIYGTPPFHQLSVLQKMRTIPDPNNVIEFPEEAVPIVPQPRGAAAAGGGCGGANGNGNGPVPPKKLYHLAKRVPLEVIESLRICLMKNPKERETIPQLLTAGWLHPKGRTGELSESLCLFLVWVGNWILSAFFVLYFFCGKVCRLMRW